MALTTYAWWITLQGSVIKSENNDLHSDMIISHPEYFGITQEQIKHYVDQDEEGKLVDLAIHRGQIHIRYVNFNGRKTMYLDYNSRTQRNLSIKILKFLNTLPQNMLFDLDVVVNDSLDYAHRYSINEFIKQLQNDSLFEFYKR